MQKNLIAPIIVGALVIAGGSFYGGMQYQKSKLPTGAAFARGAGAANRGAFAGANGRGGVGAAGAGMTAGQVVSKDANSITVQLRDGGSKVVLYSTSTRIGKMTDGTSEDLANGTNVNVVGTANADGSVTAATIQIRPAGAQAGFGGGAPQPGQPIPPAAQ